MNTFAKIDQNKLATAKQVYGVACHFANIHASAPSERYGLTKVFNAILNKFYGDQDAHMTHGEVTDFREHQVVPAQFLELIQKPKPKAKVIKETKPKASPTAKKPTPVANSVAKKMDSRITALETKVSDVDNKLDAILAILSK